eukprot:1546212-Rhodomonas_salina.1
MVRSARIGEGIDPTRYQPPMLLRIAYAMSGTDKLYGAMLLRNAYAMSGTDLGYAATSQIVRDLTLWPLAVTEFRRGALSAPSSLLRNVASGLTNLRAHLVTPIVPSPVAHLATDDLGAHLAAELAAELVPNLAAELAAVGQTGGCSTCGRRSPSGTTWTTSSASSVPSTVDR